MFETAFILSFGKYINMYKLIKANMKFNLYAELIVMPKLEQIRALIILDRSKFEDVSDLPS